MRCPKCGKDVELQNRQVGVDENGKPIFNEYAICKDCKKQWNLDKQKEKKAANSNASIHIQSKENAHVKAENVKGVHPVLSASSESTDKKDQTFKNHVNKNQINKESAEPRAKKTVKKPVSTMPPPGPAGQKAAASGRKPETPGRRSVTATKEQGLADEPSTTRRNNAARNNVISRPAAPAKRAVSQKTPAAGPGSAAKNVSGRPPVPKRRVHPSDIDPNRQTMKEEGQRYGNIPPEKVRVKREKVVRNNYEDMLAADPNKKQVKKKRPATDGQVPNQRSVSASGTQKKKVTSAQPAKTSPVIKEEPKPKFYMARIILGIVSIIAFAFFAYKGFLAGLNNISTGKESMAGTVYIVLALCMLISGLLLLIMRKKHTIFAFVLPMIFYIGGAVFAFLKRADDGFLLYGAIASTVLAVVFVVLTIVSISGNGDGYDDYDDPFEDGFEDDFEDD